MAIHKNLTGETAVHPFALPSESDPGAIGAYKAWVKISTGEVKIRNAADSAWVDLKSATDLAAHIADGADAHDASAISVADSGTNYVGDDAEEILAEIAPRLSPSGGSTGQVLKKDSGTDFDYSWQDDEEGTGGGGGATDLEGLTDVDLTSPATRQGLFWDGTNYVNAYDPVHQQAPIAKSANFTIQAGEYQYLVDASAGAVTATLPSAVGLAGKQYRIRKVDSSANAVTLAAAGSETIAGVASITLTRQYQTRMVDSDGTNWLIGASQRGGTNPTNEIWVPPWADQGSGAVFALYGDGNPAAQMERHVWAQAGLSGTGVSTTRVMLRKFRLPQDISVTSVDAYTGEGATTNGVFRFAIYRVSDGNRMWYSGDTVATIAGPDWDSWTANTPFSLDADTDYFFAISAAVTGAVSPWRTLYAHPQIGTNSANFWGYTTPKPPAQRSIGMPELAQFATTSGAMPTTMATLANFAIGASNLPTPPLFFVRGTAS